jgi:hypothetical protein
MCGGSPSAPPPPAAVPEAAAAPVAAPRRKVGRDRRRIGAGAGGVAGTILTGPAGVQDGGATAQKSLLGQ